jgi:NAD(P)-dependent dehydrogenase (short-subunit alcohol dehydrogenase family)
MAHKTWFITGTSRGFGRLWATAALERGDKVAATARDTSSLADLVERYQDAVLPVALDVTDREAAHDAVNAAHEYFRRLDVVVNNAGIGLFGAVEETSEAEAREQFDTNFFGSLWVAQAALPLLRGQGSGHILQVSSVLGVTTFPYAGLYNATKWAVEGLAQTLASEVAAFGIKTTLIEPGPYRTDWAGSARHATPLLAYDQLRDAFANSGLVFVDPANTPKAILAVVDAENPPLRVFLGTGPRETVTADYQARLDQWSAWADVATSAHSGSLPGLPIPA